MDIKQIKIFLKIYEEKNITLAAQKLFITQQALSKLLSSLEAELGVTLFTRTKYGVNPTEEGSQFRILAKNFILHYEKMLEDFTTLCSTKQISVRCGISSGFGFYITPKLIDAFRKQNPNIRLLINEYPSDVCEQMIMNGTLDVSVSLAPVDETLFESTSLRTHDMVVFVGKNHHLYERDEIAIADLKDCELVVTGEKNKLILTKLCLQENFTPNFVYTSIQSTVTYVLCGMYDYIGFSADFMAKSYYNYNPNIKLIPFKDHAFIWEMCLYYKKGNELTSASSKFMNFLMQELKSPNALEASNVPIMF